MTTNLAALPYSDFLDRIEEPVPIWLKLRVGFHNDILRALDDCKVDLPTIEFVKNPGFTWMSDFVEEFPLCRATGAKLTGAAMDDELCLEEVDEAIKKIGGDRPPLEAGPYLRGQYLNQPEGESLHIVTNPFYAKKTKSIFHVTNSGGQLWLISSPAEKIFFGKDEFVFRRFRSSRIKN